MSEEIIEDIPQKLKKRKERKTKNLGILMLPLEEDEAKNIKIKLYNNFVRQAYNFDSSLVSVDNLSYQEVDQIFRYVTHDYPELFWVHAYKYGYIDQKLAVQLVFRCLKKNGEIDKVQVNKKRRELRKASKPFLAGLNKKTDPYEAFMTIYRRLILMVDYDGKTLKSGLKTSQLSDQDDILRSLHSALVSHKIVCAGYAVALQFLLHKIGIPCAYVVSEDDLVQGGCHAYNIIKLGKSCYYVDPTWGDWSNTEDGGKSYKNMIVYEYCCTPYKEFVYELDTANPIYYHIPRREFYPFNLEYKATKYEYHRYHKTYLSSYNEHQIVDSMVNMILKYNKKENGDLVFSFRCATANLRQTVYYHLKNNKTNIIEQVKEELKKKKKDSLSKLLAVYNYSFERTKTNIIMWVFQTITK